MGTNDEDLKRSIFVPDNLSEGKEENRILPWVFHDQKNKLMELKCIMRGYNASNNPSDYQDARWSHPGFDNSQVDTSAPPIKDEENGEPYAIWTIRIDTSAADAGIRRATCEFQQGDFPLSTDFIFLIFRIVKEDQQQVVYSLGGNVGEQNINMQIEDDTKRQISEHYKVESSSGVPRSSDGQQFIIMFDDTLPSSSTTTTITTTTSTTTMSSTSTTTTTTTTTTAKTTTTSTTTMSSTSTTTTTTKTTTTTTSITTMSTTSNTRNTTSSPTTLSTTPTTAMVECRTEYITVWDTEYQEREVQQGDTKWVPECKTVSETHCRNCVRLCIE